ncbi:MAG: GAF domain-containing protein [Bacilli bacterium]|nr:GAF domain-containing protein [Bacilli bacterium]
MDKEYKIKEYESIIRYLKELIIHNAGLIANLANISALLNQYLSDINWVGFYLVQNEELIVGPFQGLPACTIIRKGRGVCGKSWETNKTIVVDDVHSFSDHIACDCNSKSEIVIPIHSKDEMVGVLDIDSPYIGRFEKIDKDNLEKIVLIIEKMIF